MFAFRFRFFFIATFKYTFLLWSLGFLSDNPVCFDWDWFLRHGKTGFKFHFIYKFLGAYRIQANSKLFQIRDRNIIESEILLKNGINLKARNKRSLWNKCRKYYYMIIKLFYHIIQTDSSYVIFIIKNKILRKNWILVLMPILN